MLSGSLQLNLLPWVGVVMLPVPLAAPVPSLVPRLVRPVSLSETLWLSQFRHIWQSGSESSINPCQAGGPGTIRTPVVTSGFWKALARMASSHLWLASCSVPHWEKKKIWSTGGWTGEKGRLSWDEAALVGHRRQRLGALLNLVTVPAG